MSSGQSAGAEEEHGELLTDIERTETAGVDGTDDGLETKEDLPAHPVDSGWAWVILFASIFEVFIFGGLMRSYGMFFVQFQQRFGSSASETALVQTVFNIFLSLSGIILMTVGMKHMSARTSICIGTLLTSGSYIISAYTTHIEVLIVFLGVVSGVAASMIYLPILSYIGIYFNKRRGLANSLCIAGASLGALVLGPVFTLMFEHYGYSGTMLLTAALLLNILVTGCLMRDPKSFAKAKVKSEHNMEKEFCSISKSNGKTDINMINVTIDRNDTTTVERIIMPYDVINEQVEDYTMNQVKSTQKRPPLYRSWSEPASTDSPIGKSDAQCSLLPNTQAFEDNTHHGNCGNLTHRVHSANILSQYELESEPLHRPQEASSSVAVLFSSAELLQGSIIAINANTAYMADSSSVKSQECIDKVVSTDCFSIVKSKTLEFLLTVFDKSLLRDPVFIHFIFLSAVSAPASFLTAMYFIPLANDIGFDTAKISILLVVNGSVDLVSKVSVGVLADKKLLRPTTIISVSFIVAGVVNNLTRVINSFWLMLTFVIIQAALAGVYISLYAVILVENLGITKFKGALGFTNMFHGGSIAAFFPITGVLRDLTGAYYWTYHVLSVLLLLGAVLAATLPLTHGRCRRKAT